MKVRGVTETFVIAVVFAFFPGPRPPLTSAQDCPIDPKTFSPCTRADQLKISHGECDAILPGPEVAEREPLVITKNVENTKNYILLMVDPDAPSPEKPVMAHWVHWVVIDIPGSRFEGGAITGSTKIAYEGPSPPVGLHRYQFLLFEQLPAFDPRDLPAERARFDLSAYLAKSGLCPALRGTFQYKVMGVEKEEEEEEKKKEEEKKEEEETTEASTESSAMPVERCKTDFASFRPCNSTSVLVVSHAPCDGTLASASLADEEPTVQMSSGEKRTPTNDSLAEEEEKFYLLFMVDPDAPSPDNPEAAYVVHWVVYNVPGWDFKHGILGGNIALGYRGSWPGTGTHRYQFLVFEQTSSFSSGELPVSRTSFDLSAYLARHRLCDSLAGSYQYMAVASNRSAAMTLGSDQTTPGRNEYDEEYVEKRGGRASRAERRWGPVLFACLRLLLRLVSA